MSDAGLCKTKSLGYWHLSQIYNLLILDILSDSMLEPIVRV